MLVLQHDGRGVVSLEGLCFIYAGAQCNMLVLLILQLGGINIAMCGYANEQWSEKNI